MAAPLEEWVEEQARLTQPDRICWCNGSEEEAHRLVEIGLKEEKICDRPVFHELNQKLWPNSYLHRSHPTDVARAEHLTFVCHPDRESAGPINDWMDSKEAKELLTSLTKGCMKGRNNVCPAIHNGASRLTLCSRFRSVDRFGLYRCQH